MLHLWGIIAIGFVSLLMQATFLLFSPTVIIVSVIDIEDKIIYRQMAGGVEQFDIDHRTSWFQIHFMKDPFLIDETMIRFDSFRWNSLPLQSLSAAGWGPVLMTISCFFKRALREVSENSGGFCFILIWPKDQKLGRVISKKKYLMLPLSDLLPNESID
jgi:hypothetical protein